eukprot:8229283-Heterocapsa_arctica.AAC.1
MKTNGRQRRAAGEPGRQKGAGKTGSRRATRDRMDPRQQRRRVRSREAQWPRQRACRSQPGRQHG